MLDSDGSQGIDSTEFAGFVAKRTQKLPIEKFKSVMQQCMLIAGEGGRQVDPDEAKRKFDELDKDGSGSLDHAELRALAKWSFAGTHSADGRPMSEAEVEQAATKLCTALDADKSGGVSFVEFHTYYDEQAAKMQTYRQRMEHKKKLLSTNKWEAVHDVDS